MRKISLLSVIILILMLSNLAYANNSNYILQNINSYTLSKTYTIKNTGNSNATDIELIIFDGTQNYLTYQKDLEIEYKPKPGQINKDKFGNKILEYKLDILPPGQSREFTVIRKASASDIEFNIDELNVQNNITDISKFQIYLQPERKIESKETEIISKAKQLTQGLTDDYSKAKAIFEFVNSYMTYDESEAYRNKGAMSALKSGRGVCEDYATLFAALCRASGIPARVIDGYRFEQDFESMDIGEWKNIESYGHGWAEFYLEDYGWIPVEVTQLYTVNGVKEVYWDGFTKLNSSKYIGTGIYNASKLKQYQEDGKYQEAEVLLKYYAEDPIVLEPVKSMIRLDSKVAGDQIEELNDNTISNDLNNDQQINQMNFNDLTKKDWAYGHVENILQKGIIKGYDDNTFRPNNNISRIEFLVMLSRMLKYLNYPEASEDAFTFNDYPGNHWSKEEYDYLANCFEKVEPSKGWLAGQTALTRVFNDKLDMNKPITRGEAVALFDKFLNEFESYDNTFIDIDNSKFKSSILKAYKNQLINGYSGNYFKPQNNITRREAAKIFDTYLNLK